MESDRRQPSLEAGYELDRGAIHVGPPSEGWILNISRTRCCIVSSQSGDRGYGTAGFAADMLFSFAFCHPSIAAGVVNRFR